MSIPNPDSVRRYRKKPVVIDAMRLTNDDSLPSLGAWLIDHDAPAMVLLSPGKVSVHIDTLEGTMVASEGDWIIRGVKGEFYPCKPDIFEATYEAVHNDGSGSVSHG